MTQETRRVERQDADSLIFQVGTPALVEPLGMGPRFRSRVVGWETGRYLIVKLPPRPEEREHLYLEKRVIVRYLDCSGQIYGFETMVRGLMYKPEKLLFLDYPTQTEILSLRKENRADCFLPAKASLGDMVLEGHILNISKSGCALALPDPDQAFAQAAPQGTVFRCEFTLATSPPASHTLEATVQATSRENDKTVLGVAFQDPPPELTEQIEAYVREILEYFSPACKAE